jgi:MurNAc alpha-1-phosphate uridylyltransferase
MKAMILAAGEGRRMQPLTDKTPKPLLRVLGRPLIEHHIMRLAEAGFTELVINVSYLGQQLIDFLGDGGRWGIAITISEEPVPLETAGGIIQALPLLGEAPFLLVNGDIYTDYPFAQLSERKVLNAGAHIVLVPNPTHNPAGDFALTESCLESRELALTSADAIASEQSAASSMAACGATYSGMGVYAAAFFASWPAGKQPLKPLLDAAMASKILSGELYQGIWEDVGTPERLTDLNERFPSGSASQ